MGWADPSSTGSAASIVVVGWMVQTSMVVASTEDWMHWQLLVEVELMWLVGTGPPSCKEPTT